MWSQFRSALVGSIKSQGRVEWQHRERVVNLSDSACTEWPSSGDCPQSFRVCRLGSNPDCSGVVAPSISFVCRLLRVHADVAVSWTVVAIIVHLAFKRVLGRQVAVESVAARICREAGGRVAKNVFVRDFDFPVPVNDGRRLEVVVDGLLVFGGAELAVDTTVVFFVASHCDGSPHRGAVDVDGVVMAVARRRKERTGQGGRGEPTEESRTSSANEMVLSTHAAARVLAASLLERRGPGGAKGETPSVHHVVNDGRFASLDLVA